MEIPTIANNKDCEACIAGLACLVTPTVPDFDFIDAVHVASLFG